MSADTGLHLAAVLAKINGPSVPTVGGAYAIGKVPSTKPASYNEVSVTRRYGGEKRGDADPGTKLYRVFIRSVATLPDNAYEMRRRAQLLENQTIEVAGVTSTPIEFETEEPIGPDDTWHSGALQLTYAL